MKYRTEVLGGKEYKIMEILGEGVYGSVVKAERDGKYYAIKMLKDHNQEIDFYEEKIVLQAIKRKLKGCKKGVLCYEDAFKQDGMFIFITKFVDGVGLDFFIKQKMMLPEDVPVILTNLITAYEMLYNVGIVHRDLKPTNILINPQTLEVTIVDFGFGCFGESFSINASLEDEIEKLSNDYNIDLIEPLECQGLRGTPMFMSPDYAKKGYATPASDIYALGIVFFFILTEGTDWIYRGSKNKGSVNDFYDYIQIPTHRISISNKLKIKNSYVDNAKATALIQEMIDIQPRKRPDPKTILQQIPYIFKSS